MDKFFREWDAASEFINEHLEVALEHDSMRSSHPVEVACLAKDVEEALDDISYEKASSGAYLDMCMPSDV